MTDTEKLAEIRAYLDDHREDESPDTIAMITDLDTILDETDELAPVRREYLRTYHTRTPQSEWVWP